MWNRSFKRFASITSFTILGLGLVWPAHAIGLDQTNPTFYDDTKRGWFWYEDPPPEPAEQVVEELSSTTGPLKTAQDFSYEELWNLYPPKFQEIYDNSLDTAVQNPSVPNMQGFMTMQDIAHRKSRAFANVASYVVQTNPSMNVAKDYPVATPGRKAFTQMKKEDKSSTIAAAKNDHALLFFYSTTCKYCVEQAGILKRFTRKYGWDIKPINIKHEPSVAAHFQIETTPTLLMIAKGNPKHIPVAYGVTAVTELENNIYRGVRFLRGETTPTNYSTYDFQKGSSFDPEAVLKQSTPY